jgi:hypothetical protein
MSQKKVERLAIKPEKLPLYPKQQMLTQVPLIEALFYLEILIDFSALLSLEQKGHSETKPCNS